MEGLDDSEPPLAEAFPSSSPPARCVEDPSLGAAVSPPGASDGLPSFEDEYDVLADLSNLDRPQPFSEPPGINAEEPSLSSPSAAATGQGDRAPEPAATTAATHHPDSQQAKHSSRREARQPDWSVYAASAYESQTDTALEGKWEFLSARSDRPQAAALLRKRLTTYQRQGLRRSVAPVFFCHLREYLHLLLLLHREERRYSLFTFKSKSWERPEDVLERKLERVCTKHRSEVEKSSSYTWVADQRSEKVAAEVGEFLGELWKSEFDEEPRPFLPPHVTRPKEKIRLYQVLLPPTCSFRLPPAFSLAAIPLCDLRPEIHGTALAGVAHLVSRFRFRLLAPSLEASSLSGSRNAPGRDGLEDEFSAEFLEALERMNTSQDTEALNGQDAPEELPPELAALAEED
ncbi:hypothetical protein NCLIV_004770 [Neospora caninum Liverpool]|uniref:Cleavage and polyadenylation specificity factor subunit 5, related n=1 Tax=Neospora caninum (strain Liverpool) TaxID=572307 RepID=F0V8F9_NEOCL|nr:hypothetical protein NCLIV_004770 [Neospora caninum Liverpool]CBZ50000.1 hypothetical protein NCLIV_004770 [Neospora caninum Liverpool]CEL64590.1 TPA: Cleavage and polyadenylation specificity factor subunit 5, related [Neospora caninum Liverpool]|eukprot:XP_003880035.1 hypothetical protein NCLIV_004770 [Neospora caninum Liverpool]